MATTEDTSDSDNDSDCDSDNDDNEELMLELKKIDQRVRRTVIEMMKRVMIQDQEIKRQKKLLKKKDEEIKCLDQVQKKNQALMAQVDELTNKHMNMQALNMELMCSKQKLVDSFATLEVAHEVMVTVMMSCVPINNTCSQNDNKEK